MHKELSSDRRISSRRAAVPSVDRVLNLSPIRLLIDQYGSDLVTDAVRDVLSGLRSELFEQADSEFSEIDSQTLISRIENHIALCLEPSLKTVFNLTGTILHTNLGRAVLPEAAINAMADAARNTTNLEFDLTTGKRGDRDSHIEDWMVRLTGCQAATIVNNNAAAVMLVLNSLALRKEVLVSRGELIEIGGSFRMPDIMMRAGCKLCEVGTTNRTHLHDYRDAISARTALIMKVHTSNYIVEGFTAEVAVREISVLARDNDIPLIIDLGSGSLIDLERYGLPHEPTIAETLSAGADLVTFSGDKLLGGPQAGIIVGRSDLIEKIRRNPMKRVLRVDKITIAALSEVLKLYADPDRLADRLPTLKFVARSATEIESLARRLLPAVTACLKDHVMVDVVSCQSQIGSGAVPAGALPSFALALRPTGAKRRLGSAVKNLASTFRALPIPVIGRIHDGTLIFDLRCLEDEAAFIAQLTRLRRT